MTTYVSVSRHGMDEPQAVIDEHAISSGNGRCVRCEVEGCDPRREALRVLAVLHQLPRRQPGATQPELIGARRVVVGHE